MKSNRLELSCARWRLEVGATNPERTALLARLCLPAPFQAVAQERLEGYRLHVEQAREEIEALQVTPGGLPRDSAADIDVQYVYTSCAGRFSPAYYSGLQCLGAWLV